MAWSGADQGHNPSWKADSDVYTGTLGFSSDWMFWHHLVKSSMHSAMSAALIVPLLAFPAYFVGSLSSMALWVRTDVVTIPSLRPGTGTIRQPLCIASSSSASVPMPPSKQTNTCVDRRRGARQLLRIGIWFGSLAKAGFTE